MKGVVMRTVLLSVIVIAVATPVFADSKKDVAALAGQWRATSVRGLEISDDDAKSITLTIEGEKYSVMVGEKGPDKGTLKLDKKDKLKTIDIVGTEGPNKGKTILAIYEHEGDNLRICYAIEDDTRPTEFKGVSGKSILITYKRVKKEK
jgi:uncharacterized protein (TIGR03067 family)